MVKKPPANAGTPVWSLVRGASTCREATKPVSAPVAAHLGPQQWPQCMEELVHHALPLESSPRLPPLEKIHTQDQRPSAAKKKLGDFPGDPVAKTLSSQSRGPEFDSSQRTRPHMPQLRPSAVK